MADSDPAKHDGDSIYATLRQDILAGAFEPGTPLRESAVAQRFGVSRTPVRAALSRLEHERILERGQRGLSVAAISTAEVLQVYDLRILLEGEAAAQAAESRGEADLFELERLLVRDRRLVDPVDSLRVATNLEFHTAIWVASHNAVLQDLLQRLSIHFIRTPHSTLSGSRWGEALAEHEQIVSAITDRDAELARTIAGAHMRTAREVRLNLLRAQR